MLIKITSCILYLHFFCLTTALTIYGFGLRGNSARKSTRKHCFRTRKPRIAPEIKQKIGMDFFGTSMPQVRILSLRPKIRRAEHNRLIKSIVLSLYLVVLWLFSQPFFFSLFCRVANKVAKILVNETMTSFFADFLQIPNALCLCAVLKKKRRYGTVEQINCTP